MTFARACLLFCVMVLTARCQCGPDPAPDAGTVVIPDAGADAGPDAAADAGTDAGADAGVDAGLRATTWLLTLDAGAFAPSPDHPSALVYMPEGFDPTPPISVVAFFHGFNSCVLAVAADASVSCDPDAGTPGRNPLALVGQFEAARKNALLIIPQLAFDVPSGNPGALATDGGLAALLDESLAQIGIADARIQHLLIASYAGGYSAAAAAITRGGVPVTELFLLDSLLGNANDFTAWVQPDRRFVDLYSTSGGTAANSQLMATGFANADGGVFDDRTTGAISDAQLAQPLVFKHVAESPNELPRSWFGRLISTSRLPTR